MRSMLSWHLRVSRCHEHTSIDCLTLLTLLHLCLLSETITCVLSCPHLASQVPGLLQDRSAAKVGHMHHKHCIHVGLDADCVSEMFSLV